MEPPRANATTVKDVFLELQARFRPDRIPRLVVYHFIISEEFWTMRVSSDEIVVTNDAMAQEADCTIVLAREIFLNTFNRTYTPSLLDLMNGRIKCDRPELLLLLKGVFRDE